MKNCQTCIHICVCDKQKVVNHKISGSVCKHFKERSCAVDLSHVMLVEYVSELGPYKMENVMLFNSNQISKEDALYQVRAGEYHPSVLTLPKRQWAALFLDRKEG